MIEIMFRHGRKLTNIYSNDLMLEESWEWSVDAIKMARIGQRSELELYLPS